MSDQNTPDPDHLDELDEALVSEFADRLAKPAAPAPGDDEPFRYVVEFESSDHITTVVLDEGLTPEVDIVEFEQARPIWRIAAGGRVEAWVPQHRMIAVFRVAGDDDEHGGNGGGPDHDGPDDDPDGPNLDGLGVQVDGDGVVSMVTDRGPSSIVGRRDELAPRRAA